MANRKPAPDNAEEIESEKWGIPNWKYREEYPKNWGDLSPNERRWEFLRRDGEYRKDFELSLTEQISSKRYGLNNFVDPKLKLDDVEFPPIGVSVLSVVLIEWIFTSHALMCPPYTPLPFERRSG